MRVKLTITLSPATAAKLAVASVLRGVAPAALARALIDESVDMALNKVADCVDEECVKRALRRLRDEGYGYLSQRVAEELVEI